MSISNPSLFFFWKKKSSPSELSYLFGCSWIGDLMDVLQLPQVMLLFVSPLLVAPEEIIVGEGEPPQQLLVLHLRPPPPPGATPSAQIPPRSSLRVRRNDHGRKRSRRIHWARSHRFPLLLLWLRRRRRVLAPPLEFNRRLLRIWRHLFPAPFHLPPPLFSPPMRGTVHRCAYLYTSKRGHEGLLSIFKNLKPRGESRLKPRAGDVGGDCGEGGHRHQSGEPPINFSSGSMTAWLIYYYLLLFFKFKTVSMT